MQPHSQDVRLGDLKPAGVELEPPVEAAEVLAEGVAAVQTAVEVAADIAAADMEVLHQILLHLVQQGPYSEGQREH